MRELKSRKAKYGFEQTLSSTQALGEKLKQIGESIMGAEANGKVVVEGNFSGSYAKIFIYTEDDDAAEYLRHRCTPVSVQ